jgi:hypothetical protein
MVGKDFWQRPHSGPRGQQDREVKTCFQGHSGTFQEGLEVFDWDMKKGDAGKKPRNMCKKMGAIGWPQSSPCGARSSES